MAAEPDITSPKRQQRLLRSLLFWPLLLIACSTIPVLPGPSWLWLPARLVGGLGLFIFAGLLLARIPSTGLMAYPEFRFRKTDEVEGASTGGYELLVETSEGVLDFDVLIYWPSQGYPDRVHGGGIERTGGWGYVHE